MTEVISSTASRRRGSSSSTVKALRLPQQPSPAGPRSSVFTSVISATVWVHDDTFSTDDILINELILDGSSIEEGSLIEIASAQQNNTQSRDFQPSDDEDIDASNHDEASFATSSDKPSRWLCLARFAQGELKAKQASLQVSIKTTIATAFGLRHGSRIRIRPADVERSTASHVEFSFRDTYLARSDMWRLIGQELSGKTIYIGQRITFLGSIRLTIKAIHVDSHKASTAFFSGLTLPIFRSEAARYVIFIQMSREMWDFDSEGNGEILFNRVINGFLPELFKRWSELEVRHLVSIVLFGRQDYRRFDFALKHDATAGLAPPTPSDPPYAQHQDFYRVVVTDMASAQWTTILDELKKDFRVFLRDICLHPPPRSPDDLDNVETQSDRKKITGRPSTAMTGNILEAINMAATQFSNDYVDRDLIRTGVSVVVITAGSGVFEVDRDLLNLTSQNLTNNGIGIDIVCLSKMPLHSVPLFKYRPTATQQASNWHRQSEASSPNLRPQLRSLSAAQSQAGSPAVSSLTSQGLHPWSRHSSSLRLEDLWAWCYGIPHWIDLSYWVPESARTNVELFGADDDAAAGRRTKGPFIPRVRMYEVQMMGLMEMGMADISIPWMSDTRNYKSSRRKRKASNVADWWLSRSLSHSPILSRRKDRPTSSSYGDQSILDQQVKKPSEKLFNMDNHDESLFNKPARPTSASLMKRSKQRPSQVPSSPEKSVKSSILNPTPTPIEAKPGDQKVQPPHSPTSSILSNMITQNKGTGTSRASRTTSYALRGLAPPVRATARTEVNIEHVQAQMPRATPVKSRPSAAATSDSLRSLSTQTNHTSVRTTAPSQSIARAAPNSERPSTPIHILQQNGAPGHDESRGTPPDRPVLQDAKRGNSSGPHSSEGSSDSEDDPGFGDFGSLASSIPRSNVPFVRNVNASNPLKGNPNREAYFGRWQHLYPRKPRAATVKWRSLCCPASVPLTTEDFPPKDALENEFDVVRYTIGLEGSNDQVEKPESRDELFREMLSLRFAHGYQLVVGSRLNRFQGPNVGDSSFFFNPYATRSDGHFSFLSMGNTIQKLSLIDKNKVEVTRYARKLREVQPAFTEQIHYEPHIRTILADQYRLRPMQLQGFSEEYPWELADKYLSASKKELDNEVEILRFWRARFVLLPVEPPVNAFGPTPTDSEENEEEIHLRGIRALTQLWQRVRYISPEERRPAQNRVSAFKKKDRNPLMISMETLNPSELVATELDKLLAAEEAGDVQTAQLLPEEEQFDRENASLQKLAAALQGERGIDIKNRRWHLRLHYSCFIGEDFTNWVVQNFRDVETQEEAIELGNDLMKEGLFEHVNSRHNFKDGNFFYSIKSEYRALRPELRQSWFPATRRSDRSVPATPLTENPARESPLSVRSRSGANLAAATTSQATSNAETNKGNEKTSKRLAVSLSKVIRLDLDIRRRSNRSEVVNLHYDRLHNPENCYHLELSWFNVTSKLVDDAVVSWTAQAEKYGLKLVEVPIREMSKVPDNEPFREPYRVKLISEPPKQPVNGANGNGNAYFTTTSFTPLQPLNSNVHFYQKQLLKRFNFVLDLEAVSEFPQNVEINYSWGKLEYQYTQFLHRSGVILAQITDEGDVLLLANRLYNSRLASTTDKSSKFEKTEIDPSAQGLRPPALHPSLLSGGQTQMQASGIVGLDVQNPTPTPASQSQHIPIGTPSPLPRPTDAAGQKISADVFGSRRALGTSGLLQYVTPEQIKDDLEDFCRDSAKLEAFYKEVTASIQLTQQQPETGAGGRPKRQGTGGTGMGSSSSSLLRPVKEEGLEVVEALEGGLGIGVGMGIPEFKLPERVTGRRQRTG